MTRITITKKDGTETPYFWLEGETDRTRVRVYKETPGGLKRMKHVRFDTVRRKFYRD
jgi:hypothetical protein